MKLAIPAAGKSLESEVSPSFGRASYFVVVDSETMEFSVIENQAVSAQGGAGIKAAEAIVNNEAEVVITFRCGENAAAVLKAAQIKIIKAISGSIWEAIRKYQMGELTELVAIHQGHYHGGK